jgi:hypothetical protein
MRTSDATRGQMSPESLLMRVAPVPRIHPHKVLQRRQAEVNLKHRAKEWAKKEFYVTLRYTG